MFCNSLTKDFDNSVELKRKIYSRQSYLSQIREKSFCWAEQFFEALTYTFPPHQPPRAHIITIPLLARAVWPENTSIWGSHVLTSNQLRAKRGSPTQPLGHCQGQCQGHLCLWGCIWFTIWAIKRATTMAHYYGRPLWPTTMADSDTMAHCYGRPLWPPPGNPSPLCRCHCPVLQITQALKVWTGTLNKIRYIIALICLSQ